METTFHERDRVIDPHAGLIADDHRLDQIATTSLFSSQSASAVGSTSLG